MSALSDLLKGTAVKTAPKSSGSALSRLVSGTATKAPIKPVVKNLAPPGGVRISLPSGNEAYKTPSGSIWEYLPDGTRQIKLASQFGNGSYNIDPSNTNKIINQGHTTYGGIPAQAGMNRDDIVPVSLGGVNTNKENIKLVPKNQNPAQLETKLAAEVKSGQTPLPNARGQILNYKQNNGETAPPIPQGVAANFISGLGSLFSKSNIKTTLKQIAGIDSPNSYVQASEVSKAASIPLSLPSIVSDILTKVVTAPVTITKNKIPLTKQGLISAYKNAPNLTDVITNIVEGQSLPNKNQKVNPALAFIGGFTGEVARQALGAYLLSSLGSKLATKSGTLEISPAQVKEVLTDPTVQMPEPVRAELAKYSETGFKLEQTSPAGGARQLVGEALGGVPGKSSTLTSEAPQSALERLVAPTKAQGGFPDNYYHQPVPEGTLDLGNPVVSESALKKLTKPNEAQAGFANPGEIASDIKGKINDAKTFIQETNKGIESSKNLEDQLFIVKNNVKADKLVASDFLKNANISTQDAEAIYHYEENKLSPLTDKQKQIYETQIKPLADETNKIVAKLRPLVPLNEDTYTPRFVKNKGNAIDRLLDVKSKVSNVLGGKLNKSAPSLKHRTMKAIVDENGKRQVVSVKNGRVTAFNNKNRSDLGALKIKTNEQLMNEDIKPIQQKLDTLQKKLDGISQVKVGVPVSPARIKSVEDDLQGIYELMDALHNQNGIEPDTKPLPSKNQVFKKEAVLSKELKTLKSINPDQTNIKGRVKAIQKKMVELSNSMGEIESKYNPNELNGKKFVAKGGKTYTIDDATTKEIEQHTNLTYHKNVLANRVVTYLKLRQISRAVEFLDKWKESPDFKNVAVKFGEENVPNGWRASKLPNFMGYAFEPHVAASLDDFEKSLASGADPLKILTALNSFLRTAIFFNPLIHVPNIGVHWLVNRGITPFIKPKGYSTLINTSKRAMQAVIHQNNDYIEALRAGANLLYADENVRNLNTLLLQKMTGELETDPQLKFFRETFPNVIKFLNPYKISGKITWGVNDIAMMQAIYEEMDKGLSLENAIKEVGKHIPNYRIPATVLKSEAVAKILKNPNITMFSAYHYGALNSYAEMAKQLVTGKNESGQSDTKNRADILDKLAMLALVTLVIYPQLDKLAKKITGNKNSFFRRAGAATFPTKTAELIEGKIDIGDYLLTFLTPAPGSKESLQEVFNLDLFTGEKIRQPGQSAKADIKATGSHVFGQISPIQQYQRLNTGQQDVKTFLGSLGGISSPKSTANEKILQSMIYDEKPKLQAELKKLYTDGKDDEAKKIIDEFNNRLKDYTVKAYEEKGQAIPPQSVVEKQYLKKPSDKVIQSYKDSKNKGAVDKLFPAPTPKKPPKFHF